MSKMVQNRAELNVSARKEAYVSACEGGRYALRSGAYTAGPSSFLARTSFLATEPAVIIRQASAKRNLVLSSFWFSMLDDTTPGAEVFVSLFRDTADRYTSGGTAFKTYQTDGVSHAAAAGGSAYSGPAFTAYYGSGSVIVATAAVNPATTAGTGTHPLYDWMYAQTVPSGPNELDLEDGVRIGQTGSILIYIWSATTAPTIVVGAEVIEEGMEG